MDFDQRIPYARWGQNSYQQHSGAPFYRPDAALMHSAKTAFAYGDEKDIRAYDRRHGRILLLQPRHLERNGQLVENNGHYVVIPFKGNKDVPFGALVRVTFDAARDESHRLGGFAEWVVPFASNPQKDSTTTRHLVMLDYMVRQSMPVLFDVVEKMGMFKLNSDARLSPEQKKAFQAFNNFALNTARPNVTQVPADFEPTPMVQLFVERQRENARNPVRQVLRCLGPFAPRP